MRPMPSVIVGRRIIPAGGVAMLVAMALGVVVGCGKDDRATPAQGDATPSQTAPAPQPAPAQPDATGNAAPASPGAADRAARPSSATEDPRMLDLPTDAQGNVTLTDAQWRERLSAEQFRILRQKGTERPYTGAFWETPASGGEYRCAACGNLLFKGTDKFISHCGWPAFDKAIKGSIRYHQDNSHGMRRTEVTCARCDGHLGHVFEDGPADTTGIRYCINSVSIKYIPDGAASKDKPTEAIAQPVPAPKR